MRAHRTLPATREVCSFLGRLAMQKRELRGGALRIDDHQAQTGSASMAEMPARRATMLGFGLREEFHRVPL
jgi:hypothetical protein